MKTTILGLIALGLCASLTAETLVTTDGTRYDDMSIQRIDPDGLLIQYSLPGNGLGVSKVKFTRLSQDQQKQYGYDAGKARDFETQTAKANDEWRANAIRMETEARAERAQEEAQTESIKTQRIMAMAQLKQAEADLARSSGNGGGGYGGYDEGGWGGYGLPFVDGIVAPKAKRTYAPIVTPVPWPRINSPRSNFRR